jgi:penicillin G amidase
LGGWNRFMLASRPEPLIYDAWLMELERGLLANKVGAGLFAALARPNIALIERILRERPDWCDDRTTLIVETCEDIVAQALDKALDGIARLQGPDMETWQWGREHPAAHRHPLFDAVPLLRDVASVRFVADGGANTLNRAEPAYVGPHPFEAVHGATYRGVYDLDDLENSRFAVPLGQSGNMFSPWAHNYLERWQSLSYLEIPGSRADASRGAVGAIALSPPAR